jgi:diguanylate cyclase (GGDEF)-like protein/PAS domain S-box-containing protein
MNFVFNQREPQMTTATRRPLTTYSAISLLLLCLLLCTATVGHCTPESRVPTAPRKLVAAIPADLPPTYFLDKSGKPAGFAVDVMNELARRTGLTVEYVSGQAFDDVIQMVLTGKADLIPSLTIDEQRKELLAFTDTVGFLPANLIVASGNLTVQGISPGLTIGVMKGSAPENLLMKNQTIRLTTFTNLETMLFELLAGHVDGIVFLTPNLMKLAIDAGVEDKIKVVGKPKPYWTADRIGAVSGILLVLIVCGMAFWRYRSIVRLNNRLTLSIAEHKQAEGALRESEIKLQAIFDTVGTGIIIIDRDTQIIIEANQTAIEMTGLPQERIIGHICHSLICPAQAGKCPVKHLGQSVDHSERKLLHADGRQRDVLKTVYPITIQGRECYLESFIDITERKRTEEALRESEERYRVLVENASDLVFRLDDTGHFTFTNPSALRITGYEEKEIIGRHYPSFIRPDMREEAMKFFGRQFVKGIPNTYSEYPITVKDGREIWFGQNTQLIFQDGKVVAFQAVARDITERKRIEEALRDSENRYRELSIVDDLTQLYNSRHFYFQLKIELDRSNRYEQPLTLLLLDLDNFKAFNDAYGHVEGDQVLMRLGQVVKRCLRETDFAYRYGGEEFTILLPMTTSADGAVTAERIRTAFKKETFSPAPGQDVHVTVSIGIAQYKPQEEMKVFVHRVDQLMYQGKKNGKDRVCSES